MYAFLCRHNTVLFFVQQPGFYVLTDVRADILFCYAFSGAKTQHNAFVIAIALG